MTFYRYFGLLHAMTICALIVSIRPAVNALNIATFAVSSRR